MRLFKNRKKWLALLGLACLLLSTAGCGGDAYEKQFDDSLQHLKSTGLPLGHEPAPPPQTNPPANDQQPPAQQQPHN